MPATNVAPSKIGNDRRRIDDCMVTSLPLLGFDIYDNLIAFLVSFKCKGISWHRGATLPKGDLTDYQFYAGIQYFISLNDDKN
jgi:hypothetical protein